MAAVTNVLRVSQELHASTQQGVDLQQNVRAALSYMCRELVNAGSGVPYLTTFQGNSYNGCAPINVPNGAKLGPLGDSIAVTGAVNFITPQFQAGDTVTLDGEGNALAAGIPTDRLVFLGGTGDARFVNQNAPGPSANFGGSVYVTNNVFATGDVVLISNGFLASLGQVTAVAANGELRFQNGADTLDLNPGSTAVSPNPNMDAARQLPGGPPPEVFPLASITYFVDATTNPRRPSMRRLANSDAGRAGAVLIAEDIENLQLRYLVDTDANSATPAVQVANPTAAQLQLIRGVNVSITGRSRARVRDASWPDRHSRLTLNQTVFFRNNIRR